MPWNIGDEFNARQETIKCVVVGDTAVGKTRLICARTCNAGLNLPQMLTTHVPTVWAIDQYRIHKEVLRRSRMTVDGVDVSLRLWDTFGDHEKDRKFAYGRSDVVLLCFSISSPQSFKHCKTKWYPEIRQYCPQAPILLVGCKNDLRHRDDNFLTFCNNRPFLRHFEDHELITREEGRTLANEIGAAYYEASVYTYYGIDDVFENALRLALRARRLRRFWAKNLKNVLPPAPQVPYLPPRPKEPEVQTLPSTFHSEIRGLLDKGFASDVNIKVGEDIFHNLVDFEEHENQKKDNILENYQHHFKSNLKEICLEAKFSTDVIFEVDDGECYAHRSILMARCEVMSAMFRGDFKESSTERIPFPGATKSTFNICLHYLYTDAIEDNITIKNGPVVIELANRLCLPRLISLVEKRLVSELKQMYSKDITEYVFQFLEICQLHNADQLFEWCQHYIITNYKNIDAEIFLKRLDPDYQIYLSKNRWPPLQYLTEQDFYDASMREYRLNEITSGFTFLLSARKRFSNCINSFKKPPTEIPKLPS